MCGSTPDVPQPRTFQDRQSPVFRDTVAQRRGRRGTNLTDNDSAATDENQGQKKTLLGQ